MKIENPISWCDDTGNKVTGCTKISPGCSRCYAAVGTRARVLRAQGIETWGPKGHRYPVKDFSTKVRRLNKLCVCDKCHVAEPWKSVGERCIAYYPQGTAQEIRRCKGILRRIRFFADSNSDWLDDKWPIETLADLLKDIHDCPNVDFQLLTKRPENFMDRLELARLKLPPMSGHCYWLNDWVGAELETHPILNPPHNVWIGVSVEDQKRADERIPQLLQIPAKVRFLSVEPLLEAVDLSTGTYGHNGKGQVWDAFGKNAHCPHGETPMDGPGISWVIVGGESGKDRRDCGVEAIVDVARQCQAAGVPVFCKQDAAFKPGQQGRLDDATWALKQFPHP